MTTPRDVGRRAPEPPEPGQPEEIDSLLAEIDAALADLAPGASQPGSDVSLLPEAVSPGRELSELQPPTQENPIPVSAASSTPTTTDQPARSFEIVNPAPAKQPHPPRRSTRRRALFAVVVAAAAILTFAILRRPASEPATTGGPPASAIDSSVSVPDRTPPREVSVPPTAAPVSPPATTARKVGAAGDISPKSSAPTRGQTRPVSPDRSVPDPPRDPGTQVRGDIAGRAPASTASPASKMDAAKEPPAAAVVPPATSTRDAAVSPAPGASHSVTASDPHAADRAAIERVLDSYRESYNRLDVPAAATVWRSLDAKELTRMFATLKSQDLKFDRCDVELEGVRATARCVGRLSYVPSIGVPAPRTRILTWDIQLSQLEDGWLIERVTAR